MENSGKSALGLDANVTALIGYIVGLVALILIFVEKENKFVRFHAFQSVLWSVGMGVAIFVIAILGFIIALVLGQVSETLGSIVGLLVMLLYLGLILALLGGLIFGAVKAFGGNVFKLPVVGNLAEKWSN